MKTFIWSWEYEVLAANAETVEEARKMLEPLAHLHFEPELKDQKERMEKNPDYFKNCENYTWENAIKETNDWIDREVAILEKEPDFIIESGAAMIFRHANE